MIDSLIMEGMMTHNMAVALGIGGMEEGTGETANPPRREIMIGIITAVVVVDLGAAAVVMIAGVGAEVQTTGVAVEVVGAALIHVIDTIPHPLVVITDPPAIMHELLPPIAIRTTSPRPLVRIRQVVWHIITWSPLRRHLLSVLRT